MISSSSPPLEGGLLPADATRKLTLFAAGPIVLLDLDPAATVSVLQLADTHAIDLIDAIMLHLAHQHADGYLTTEDRPNDRAWSQIDNTDPHCKEPFTVTPGTS